MTSTNAKAAQLWQAGGDRQVAKLGSYNTAESTTQAVDLQVSRLTRSFLISLPLAAAVASLVYGEAQHDQ